MRLLHQKKWFVVILLFSYVNSFASLGGISLSVTQETFIPIPLPFFL